MTAVDDTTTRRDARAAAEDWLVRSDARSRLAATRRPPPPCSPPPRAGGTSQGPVAVERTPTIESVRDAWAAISAAEPLEILVDVPSAGRSLQRALGI